MSNECVKILEQLLPEFREDWERLGWSLRIRGNIERGAAELGWVSLRRK